MTIVRNNSSLPPPPPPPAWCAVEDEALYHARSKSGEVMSSGMLRKFRDCPYAYRQAVLGLAAERDSNAFRFGRAVHKIVLEGIPAFNASFAIGGPVNPKTGRSYAPGTKAFDDWLSAHGLAMERVVSQEEADTLVTMAYMLRRHDGAVALLDDGWPELVARAIVHGVLCQIRMDWLTKDAAGRQVVVDLKTADDLSWFESDARRYGYLHQFAFYRDVLQEASGGPVAVAAVALEKKAPFRVGVWRLSGETLDYYAAENRLALEEFARCRDADDWPTGYEAVREFGAPQRMGA